MMHKTDDFNLFSRLVAQAQNALAANDPVAARRILDETTSSDRNQPLYLWLSSVVNLQTGKFEQAQKELRLLVQIDPNNNDAANNLALLYEQQHKYDEAERLYRGILQRQVGHSSASKNLAEILINRNQTAQALTLIIESLRRNPTDASLWNILGIAQLRSNQISDAENSFRKSATLNPNRVDVLNNLAALLIKNDRNEEAITLLTKAIDLRPNYFSALTNLGTAYTNLYRFDDAEIVLNKALTIDPRHVDCIVNTGRLSFEKGEYTKSIEIFNRALAIDPNNADTHWHRSLSYLILGDYKNGWVDYEFGFVVGERKVRPIESTRWDGLPLVDEKLLVLAEQGLGDEIMFATCFPDVTSISPNAYIECDRRLLPLFERSFPKINFFARNAPPPPVSNNSKQIAAGSLPSYFRPALEKFPRRASILKAEPKQVAQWKSRLRSKSKRLLVGISWRGGSKVDPKKRSIDLVELQPILTNPKCDFVNLQYGDHQTEIENVEKLLSISILRFNDCDPLNEQDNFAALIESLDLVISVSNATVHLAGALGVPCWVLLPYVPSWRWKNTGTTTPWYESLLLFRQTTAGVWTDVIDDVSRKLLQYGTTHES